jgi:hypothetical protein
MFICRHHCVAGIIAWQALSSMLCWNMSQQPPCVGQLSGKACFSSSSWQHSLQLLAFSGSKMYLLLLLLLLLGDKSAMVPGGMRIGTPALTTRGFKEAEFVQVANFIDMAVKIAKDCQAKTPAPGQHK